jgi:cytochrome c oxidase cbb3-type subunit 4
MSLEGLYADIAPLMGVVVVAVFIGIVAWAYWPKHRARFEADGQIPLRDDR